MLNPWNGSDDIYDLCAFTIDTVELNRSTDEAAPPPPHQPSDS